MTLADLFKVRDALRLLCDYGYELTDMLDKVEGEIKEKITWRVYEKT